MSGWVASLAGPALTYSSCPQRVIMQSSRIPPCSFRSTERVDLRTSKSDFGTGRSSSEAGSIWRRNGSAPGPEYLSTNSACQLDDRLSVMCLEMAYVVCTMWPTSNRPDELRTWWCSATATRNGNRPVSDRTSTAARLAERVARLTGPTSDGTLVTLYDWAVVAKGHVVPCETGHLGLVGRVNVETMQRRLQKRLQSTQSTVSKNHTSWLYRYSGQREGQCTRAGQRRRR